MFPFVYLLPYHELLECVVVLAESIHLAAILPVLIQGLVFFPEHLGTNFLLYDIVVLAEVFVILLPSRFQPCLEAV